jgi:hypothetical protein
MSDLTVDDPMVQAWRDIAANDGPNVTMTRATLRLLVGLVRPQPPPSAVFDRHALERLRQAARDGSVVVVPKPGFPDETCQIASAPDLLIYLLSGRMRA